jgi:hypothetical protein
MCAWYDVGRGVRLKDEGKAVDMAGGVWESVRVGLVLACMGDGKCRIGRFTSMVCWRKRLCAAGNRPQGCCVIIAGRVGVILRPELTGAWGCAITPVASQSWLGRAGIALVFTGGWYGNVYFGRKGKAAG